MRVRFCVFRCYVTQAFSSAFPRVSEFFGGRFNLNTSNAAPLRLHSPQPQHTMGRVKKSTRKFEAKHLTRTLEDRKSKKKVKQAFILREKKKAKRQANREDDAEDGDEPKAKKQKPDGPQIFENMSVEQFFAGGFEVPKEGKTKTTTAGKRKRGAEEEKKPAQEEDEDEDMADAANDDSEDDEIAQHKDTLGALADQDPEFYKYLKENDPELLDFSMAERDDLSSIDELSEGEDEAVGKKKKKGKGVAESDEVTMAAVKKWKEALVDKKSLRSLRQVVLAFRAAAHVNDSEDDRGQGGFKYSITNPDGMLTFPVPVFLRLQWRWDDTFSWHQS
jgi:nucleolar complex protein 2